MKKAVLILIASSLVAGCGSKDKDALEQALIKQFDNDSDINDYNIPPEEMATCVFDGITSNIPGPPWGSAKKDAYYRAYTQLLAVRNQPSLAPQVMQEAQTTFGSSKATAAAVLSISENSMRCVSDLVTKSGQQAK